MENGGVDSTANYSQQQKMGQMTDIPPLLASSVFDLWKHECTSKNISDHVAYIDEFSEHNFIQKICWPRIENKQLWVCY